MNRVIFFLNAIALTVICSLCATQVLAQASSTNFQLFGAQTTPVGGALSSSNFSIDGGGNPTGGRSTGTSFNANIGAPVGSALVASGSSSSGSSAGVSRGGGRTPDVNEPAIQNVTITPINRSQVRVTFDTDILAVTSLTYGSAPAIETPEETDFALTHTFVLDSIVPNLVYPLTIEARSASGGVNRDDSFQFRIEQVLPSVPNVRNPRAAAGANTVAVTWEPPSTEQYSYLILRQDGVAAIPGASARAVFDASVLRFEDAQVTIGSTYTYFIYTVADDGRRSSGVFVRATIGDPAIDPAPGDPTAPSEATATGPSSDPTAPGDDGDGVVPAQPPALPDGTEPVPEEETLDNDPTFRDNVSFFSVVEQHVSRRYLDARDALASLPTSIKEKVSEIARTLFDEFGRVRQDIVTTLTGEERTALQEVANVHLPEPGAFNADPTTQRVVTELEQDETGRWHVLAGSDALLSVPRSLFQKPVTAITVTIQTAAFMLEYNPESDAYESVISTPEEKGEYEMLLQVIYEDNSFDEIHQTVLVDPYGTVYTRRWKSFSWRAPWRFFQRETVPVANATVSLHTKNRVSEWALWPAALYNQFNPQVTDADGTFAFFVPPGEYRIDAAHPAFKNNQMTDTFLVENDLVNRDVFLTSYDGFWSRAVLLLSLFVILGTLVKRPKQRAKKQV